MFYGAVILFIAPPQAPGQYPEPEKAQTESVQPLFSYDIEGPPGLLVKQRVDPAYPPQARMARIQAYVSLDVKVEADGSVTSVKPLSGHPLPVGAACDAVRQWKFDPSPQLPAHVTVEVHFQLAGTSPSAEQRKYLPDWESGLTPLSPDYPREAILRGIEGQVALEVTIDSNRQLSDLRVLKSDSGLLTSAAVRMIQTPRFPRVCPPPEPTPCTKRAVIDFELNQRDHSKDHVLFLAPKVVQAPPDLLITHREVAIYPVDAHDLEGNLRIKLTVDQKGEVSDVEILSGPEPLAAAALKAAVKMRFAPPSTAPAEVILDYHF
jgi:TonB family protein